MQSFREQSSYNGNQQTYSPEAHGPSRMEEYSPRQQAPIFQSGYGGRRGGTVTPTAITPGENSSLQSFQAYRKESGDFYYLGNKEGGPPGGQTPQRRPAGPVQSYGPPQGNTSSSSTGYGSHYGREGHHSQFAGQPSAAASLSQYSQNFTGSFSPGGGQYSSHVSSQQLRQLYQSHQPLPQSGNTPASAGSSQLQQMQRSPVGYPLRVGQLEQHYQSSAGSPSSSFPLQRFGQSGTNYEGYSPGGPTSPYDSHMSGSSYGTQQGYSSYASQHLKNFDTDKLPQSQGQQPQNPPHVMQYSNSSKLLPQSQTGQYNQSDVSVQSPIQLQQNFSPISNPSPAASVVQSPSCSSTPSPLMTSGENIQCGQGNLPLPSRNRILPVMPQLSPNTQISSFKGFAVEGLQEKHLTDPGLNSLSALSSQVANLPNTVQHMLLSDALAPHKKGGKRTSRKTDSCANSETSSQAEEQLKSPMAESLDGSCSSSTGDPGERLRRLSGQSSSSEMGFKGLPSEKPTSPAHVWQNEPLGQTAIQEIDTVPEPAETFQEIPKASEKSVGVIVSMETVAHRPEKVVDDILTPVNDDFEQTPKPELPETANDENVKDCPISQDREPNTDDPVSITTTNIPQVESVKSPVGTGFDLNNAHNTSQNPSNQHPKNSDMGNFGGQSDRKSGRGEKYPSLLQEVLQGHHQQERRYAINTQEHPVVAVSPEIPSRPNVLVNQANDQPNRNILGKSLAPHLESSHWSQWDRKSILEMKQIHLLDYNANRKFEVEPPTVSHEQSGIPSERRSVICDISPLRQLVREPNSSQNVGIVQERLPEGRAGQSVILPSRILSMERSNSQGGVAKGEDIETPKVQKKRTGEQCMLYSTKDSARGNASPRSMTYEPNQSLSSQNNRVANPKRGTGRVGSRGRSSAQSQELSNRLKMSPGRSRGPTEVHHINPTMSLSERASRDAIYSAFFPKTDSSTLGYHTNSRSSSYGEPHPTFSSSLHYKRHMYQQEQYKQWLGNSAQAILSASQHCQEVLRKSPRQESFHVRSPGRRETEGLGYSQQTSYHESSNIDYGRQLRMGERINADLKGNSQKSPSGEPLNWYLGRHASPLKKVGSPIGTNPKPFSPIRESETHRTSAEESVELPKLGCNAHKPSGPEEVSHHNPLIMRRRVRSFISPIPSKKHLLDDKGRPPTSIPKEGPDITPSLHSFSPRGNDGECLCVTEESTGPEQRSPPKVSLSSPTKTKILPPRKGRGLKLEAIVQKITSPNVRRISASSSSESALEPVTLDDFLSLKGKESGSGNGFVQEEERAVDVLPDLSSNEEIKIHRLSPKSLNTCTIQDDKQIKMEIAEQSIETIDLSQTRALIQQTSNHVMEGRGTSPTLESKCPLPQVQPHAVADNDKIIITPKQEIIPPKGYFPSGKKKRSSYWKCQQAEKTRA